MSAATAYSVERLRLACHSRLPKCLLDFYEGGAEDEITLRANAAQFSGATLWPRVLQGVAMPHIARSLFGVTHALPFGIAPMGACGFGWHQADTALCRAAAASDTVYTLSTMATASLEEIAATEAPHRWFQAHLFQPRSRTHDLIAARGRSSTRPWSSPSTCPWAASASATWPTASACHSGRTPGMFLISSNIRLGLQASSAMVCHACRTCRPM